MASLTGSTIAASYEQLLSLPDGGLNGNTLVAITDGDSSTAIGMKVATSKIEVIPASDDANAFEVSNAAGTAILTINSSTTSASLVQTVTTATSTPKALFIDTNTSGVAAQNSVGMHIDFDRTVAGSGTAAHNDIGIDLDVNSASLGTSSLVGMDIDVVGATSGTSTATGVNIAVGSADTNYALITSGGNVGIGVADPDETLEVSGDAKVSGNLYFYDTGGESISSNGSVLSIAGGAEIDLTATDIDINGAANISGALVIGGDVSMTQAGQAILHVNSTGDAAQLKLSALSGDGNYEWSIYSNNAADQFLIVDGSATRLVIDSDGFVGIGTTAPRSAQGYSGSILEIGSADDVALVLTSDDGEAGENMWEIGNNTSGVLQFVHSVAGDGSTGTKMVVDASGKVGIGVSAPATTLDIHSAGSEVAAAFGMADDGPAWIVSRTGEAVNNYSAYAFMVGATATDSVASANTTAYIASTVKSDGTGETLKGDLHFYTNAGDSLSTAKMMINQDGEVGIGHTNPQHDLCIGDNTSGHVTAMRLSTNTDATSQVLWAIAGTTNKWSMSNSPADQLYIYDYGDSSIAAHIDTTDNDWQAGSDLRIKKDINNIGSTLDAINSLRPITWKRKYGKTDKVYPGLVAQEVLPHIPLVVGGSEDSFKEVTVEDNVTYEGGLSIGYGNFVPYLIKAIQELSAKVEALENA